MSTAAPAATVRIRTCLALLLLLIAPFLVIVRADARLHAKRCHGGSIRLQMNCESEVETPRCGATLWCRPEPCWTSLPPFLEHAKNHDATNEKRRAAAPGRTCGHGLVVSEPHSAVAAPLAAPASNEDGHALRPCRSSRSTAVSVRSGSSATPKTCLPAILVGRQPVRLAFGSAGDQRDLLGAHVTEAATTPTTAAR